MRREKLIVLILAFMLLTLPGCTTLAGAATERPSFNKNESVFSGSILSVNRNTQSIIIAVIVDDQELIGDQASVALTADSRISDADDNTLTFSELAEGDVLTVAITGGIRESYPVQVTARQIFVHLNGR